LSVSEHIETSQEEVASYERNTQEMPPGISLEQLMQRLTDDACALLPFSSSLQEGIMRYIPGRIPVILAVSNLFFTCAVSVDLTIATLVGYQLAPSDELATVPFALITVAGAFSSLFAAGMIGRETKTRVYVGVCMRYSGRIIVFSRCAEGQFFTFLHRLLSCWRLSGFQPVLSSGCRRSLPAGSEGAVYLWS
jgi:hypothetical protein